MYRANIQRGAGCNAEPPPLTESIVDDALVPADSSAVTKNKVSGGIICAADAPHSRGIVAVGGKADVLAVVLSCIYKAVFLGDISRLCLCH